MEQRKYEGTWEVFFHRIPEFIQDDKVGEALRCWIFSTNESFTPKVFFQFMEKLTEGIQAATDYREYEMYSEILRFVLGSFPFFQDRASYEQQQFKIFPLLVLCSSWKDVIDDISLANVFLRGESWKSFLVRFLKCSAKCNKVTSLHAKCFECILTSSVEWCGVEWTLESDVEVLLDCLVVFHKFNKKEQSKSLLRNFAECCSFEILSQVVINTYLPSLEHYKVDVPTTDIIAITQKLVAFYQLETAMDKKSRIALIRALSISTISHSRLSSSQSKKVPDNFVLEEMKCIQVLVSSIFFVESKTFPQLHENERNIPNWLIHVVFCCAMFMSPSSREFSKELKKTSHETLELIEGHYVADGKHDKSKENDRDFIIPKKQFQKLLIALLHKMLPYVSSQCTQDEWLAPDCVYKVVFQWYIEQIPFPYLGGNSLGLVVALILPLLEDSKSMNQKTALVILRHVQTAVTPTELSWYEDVLLQAMDQSLSIRDPELLEEFLPCLCELLVSLSSRTSSHQVAYYNRFFPRLVQNMNLAVDLPVKIQYMRHIRSFIAQMGVPNSFLLIKYIQPLLRVMESALQQASISFVVESLTTLKTIISAAYIRIMHHYEKIISMVLRVILYQSALNVDSDDSSNTKEVVIDSIKEILQQLLWLEEMQQHDSTVREENEKLHGAQEKEQVKTTLQYLHKAAQSSKRLEPFCSQFVQEVTS